MSLTPVQPHLTSVMDTFKCTHTHCKYGPAGRKSFKRQIFLQNHLKNVHEEKIFQCDSCNEKFAFDWQLKYHCKHCGTEFKCTTCEKTYSKPMSLVMHSKRSLHPLPIDKQFKLRKNSHSNHSYILIPVLVDKLSETESVNLISLHLNNHNSALKNKHILPKTEAIPFYTDLKQMQFSELSSPKISKTTKKKATHAESGVLANKRSTESQTVRKRNRVLSCFELKSTQTQTLHSSFDMNVNKIHQKVDPQNKKCSSFTQTLIDDIEQCEFIMKDPFLANEINQLEQAVQTEFSANIDTYQLENYCTSETQTNANMTDLGREEMDAVDGETSGFKFPDLEFIDIETQTIWNYDRTTQTEQALENWIMNL